MRSWSAALGDSVCWGNYGRSAPDRPFVRHLDRLFAEMGDQASWKAERRRAWSPALPPPFNRNVVKTGLGEMMARSLRARRFSAFSCNASAARRCSACSSGS